MEAKVYSHLTRSLVEARPSGKPVDNRKIEEIRAEFRSDLAAEVRLREEAQRDLLAAQAQIERLTAELSDRRAAFEEAVERLEAMTGEADDREGTLQDLRRDLAVMTEKHADMHQAHSEAGTQLLAAQEAAAAARATVEELRRQLKTQASDPAVTQRLERIEKLLKDRQTAKPIEPPEYEFVVTSRDGNNRAAAIRAKPVKP